MYLTQAHTASWWGAAEFKSKIGSEVHALLVSLCSISIEQVGTLHGAQGGSSMAMSQGLEPSQGRGHSGSAQKTKGLPGVTK